jgi:AraC family transcriptional regulator of adaptative response/methylated-DNA-[protein]-cysteine methyltransferase
MTMPPEADMWDGLMARDSEYDGVFFTAVRTTGIFCRPTCAARKPRRENVSFYESI